MKEKGRTILKKRNVKLNREEAALKALREIEKKIPSTKKHEIYEHASPRRLTEVQIENREVKRKIPMKRSKSNTY